MSKRTRLTVVAPCFNEVEGIQLFHQKLSEVLLGLTEVDAEILYIDDGSSDGTLPRLQELAAQDDTVSVLSFSRNFGHQMALTAGLDLARGDVVVCLDTDLQHPPEQIPRMLELWREGHDIVSCVRAKTARAGFFKNWTSSLFYKLINALSDTPIPAGAADFFLISRPVQKALRGMPERHRFLRGMVSWVGFRRGFLSYDAPARVAGHSKYNAARMVALALDATFSFSTTPIKLTTRFGAAIVASGIVYLLFIFVRAIFYGDLVQGWGSLISTILILGGFQILSLGLVGEYVARIFDESKRRPLYLFKYRTKARKYRKKLA